MIALRLVRLMENHSEELSEGLLHKFEESPRTQDFSRVPREELRERVHEILKHLGEWLLQKKENDIESRYREIGARRGPKRLAFRLLLGYCADQRTHLGVPAAARISAEPARDLRRAGATAFSRPVLRSRDVLRH